jgi:acyl-CoA thioester hydrolase
MTTAFSHPLRVRWAEVDAQGVVFNPNYFLYADVAATEFLRALGVVQTTTPDLLESYVVDARASFRAPARFDDLLDIGVRVDRIGRSSYALRIDVMRDGAVLVEVWLTYVRAVDGASIPLSETFRLALAATTSAGESSEDGKP